MYVPKYHAGMWPYEAGHSLEKRQDACLFSVYLPFKDMVERITLSLHLDALPSEVLTSIIKWILSNP